MDEALIVQRPSTSGHASLKSIPTGKSFILTGTFIPNKLHGILDLLPGINPVRDSHLFLSVFATKTKSGFDTRTISLEKRSLLIRFLIC